MITFFLGQSYGIFAKLKKKMTRHFRNFGKKIRDLSSSKCDFYSIFVEIIITKNYALHRLKRQKFSIFLSV